MLREEYDPGMNEPFPERSDTDTTGSTAGAPATLTSSGTGRVLGVLRIVCVFVAAGLLVVLTLQNTDDVTLHFLVWTITLSRALLVFLLIVVGALIGWILRSMRDDEGFRPLG